MIGVLSDNSCSPDTPGIGPGVIKRSFRFAAIEVIVQGDCRLPFEQRIVPRNDLPDRLLPPAGCRPEPDRPADQFLLPPEEVADLLDLG
jgi:hypothetical protein